MNECDTRSRFSGSRSSQRCQPRRDADGNSPEADAAPPGRAADPGSSACPWRVRLYAPEDGGTRYQVIFTRAEAALDTESEAPVGGDVRAARAIRILGRSTQGSIERGRRDLRGQLAAMRELAWRLGWLDLSVDPPAPRRTERALGDRWPLRARLRPHQRLVDHAAHGARLPRPGNEPHRSRGTS